MISWALKKKEKVIRISLGLLCVLLGVLSFFDQSPFLQNEIALLEKIRYDILVELDHPSLPAGTPIVIVDIDDKALQEQGRWPWPRSKLADLTSRLYQEGAVVVAFDMTFPEAELNIAHTVGEAIESGKLSSSISPAQIQEIEPFFDYDEQFAKSLRMGSSVLGMVFKENGTSTGDLPRPLLQLSEKQASELTISERPVYLANISKLEAAVKTAGFINASPDTDGVLRSTPLIFRHGLDVFGSLSFEATLLYLLSQKVELCTSRYGDENILEGIRVDNLVIPVDPTGRMIIPYVGPPFSFPYVSAGDVLAGKVPAGTLSGKLVFVGSTATAIGDNVSSPLAHIFPGVEIHASVAAGLMNHYLPFSPSWEKGALLVATVVFGLLYAFWLPFCGILRICLIFLPIPVLFASASVVLWKFYGIMIAMMVPFSLVSVLFLLNVVCGYFFESLKGVQLKSMFGQYVPSAYLEDMLKQGEKFSLEGETKELSVLFADIRNFTNLSEKMTAGELKKFLNEYFNPITEILFEHKGTIDKYVGDMVMAFWGAPLSDSSHARSAVAAGMAMQKKLLFLNQRFLREHKPQIKIGVGINTGMMNVGDMGSDFRRSYTVIGDSVNLASRLEGQTKFYHVDILVGESTWHQTKNQFIYRKIDKIKVKGKDQAIEIFSPECLVEEETPDMKRELDLHHQALEMYFLQDWEGSKALFLQLQREYPCKEGLYGVYLDRLEILKQTSLGPEWDGTYISHEK